MPFLSAKAADSDTSFFAEFSSSDSDSPFGSAVLPSEDAHITFADAKSRDKDIHVSILQEATAAWKPSQKCKEEDDYEPMTWRCELRAICKLAIPVAISTVARVSMYSIDTAFLGHLSTDKLAAAALSMTVFNFVSSFVYSPAISLNSLCSQAIGAGNPQLAGRWLQIANTVGILFCVPACVVFWNVDFFLQITENDSDILRLARRFSHVAMFIPFPTVLYVAIRQYFQALEIVYPATVVSCICVGLNVAFNWLFIKHLGYIGSPLATFTSVCCQIVFFYTYAIVFRKYHVKTGTWDGRLFALKKFCAERQRLKEFFKVVLPITVSDMGGRWALQIVILQAGRLPSEDMAAFQIVWQIYGMLWSFYWGFGLATIVRVGRHIGRGDVDSAKMCMRMSLTCSLALGVVIGVLVFALRHYIAMCYTHDVEVKRQIVGVIPVVCMCYMTLILRQWSSAVLEGLSRNKVRGAITLINAWVIYLPLASYLAYYSPLRRKHRPVDLVYWVQFGANLASAICMCAVLFFTDWKQEVENAQMRSEVNLKSKRLLSDQLDAGQQSAADDLPNESSGKVMHSAADDTESEHHSDFSKLSFVGAPAKNSFDESKDSFE